MEYVLSLHGQELNLSYIYNGCTVEDLFRKLVDINFFSVPKFVDVSLNSVCELLTIVGESLSESHIDETTVRFHIPSMYDIWYNCYPRTTLGHISRVYNYVHIHPRAQ